VHDRKWNETIVVNSFKPPVTNMKSYMNSRNTYTV